jgi:hypothetical protein
MQSHRVALIDRKRLERLPHDADDLLTCRDFTGSFRKSDGIRDISFTAELCDESSRLRS